MKRLRRMMTVRASTKRFPAMDAGKRGAAAAHLASLVVCPLDPVGSEAQRWETLDIPVDARQTFTQKCDVIAGDVLVVDGVDYPVHLVRDWDGPSRRDGDRLLHLILQRPARAT